MTLKEMRQMAAIELRTEASKLEAKIWKVRFQARGEPIENPGQLKKMRRDRARLLTILREKQPAGGADDDGSTRSARATAVAPASE